MLRRVLSLAIVLSVSSLSAQPNPMPQQKEIIEWVIRSLIEQQKQDWNDWSASADRRVVLLANETIALPTFAADDYGLNYALESLNAEGSDLSTQLRSARIVDLGTWKLAPHRRCGREDEAFPQLNVVPARTLIRTFKGEGLDSSVALVIRISTPVFSKDGLAAAVYAEAIGSHVENSHRQLISLTRKRDSPGEWDAMIHSDRLFPTAKPMPQEREINTSDRAAITAALQWLVTKRGEFDLVGLADFPPDPTEWRRRERESESSFEVPEATLAQLCRRNSEELVFDPSIFAIEGVRSLAADDKRVWSRASVLVSLPAYDGDVAILNMTYRTSDEIPETADYLVLMRRSSGNWSVVWTAVQEGVIVS